MPWHFAVSLLAVLALAQPARQVLGNLRNAEDAGIAERAVFANPQNSGLVGAVLDFYLARWSDPAFHAGRMKFLGWVIDHRADIDLAAKVHDFRGLLVSPDDKEAYAPVREAWLRQTARQPSNVRVLSNAARCLRLTDRQSAANWLKTAASYDTGNTEFNTELAVVYADALTGVAAMNPYEHPTRVDAEVTKSVFARQAKEEAMQDSVLSAQVGWNVHLIAMELRTNNLTATDYDTLAEELLLNAANLDYPKPAKIAYLAQFYRDQALKVTHKIAPKFPQVDLKPEQVTNMLVDFPKKIYSEDITKPVKIPLNVLVGIDGHVWKAESPERENDTTTRTAAASLMGFTFKPLRVSGEPLQVMTTFLVTVEPPPAKGK